MKRIRLKILFAVLALLASLTASAGAGHRIDVNCDGHVSISDVTALIDYLLGVDVAPFNVTDADINGDGRVTITDVVQLIDYLLSGEDLNPCVTETFTVNGVRFTMSVVEGGTFMMGYGEYNYWRPYTPAHQVTLSSSFSIGQTEVTQALWTAVMGSNPSYQQGKWGFIENPNRPVEDVTWDDCQEFISRLNELTGRTFRLPTEAEWEFAARGGNKSKGYTYSGSNVLGDVGWYRENVKIGVDEVLDPDYGTHPVAMKSPNELGLYDMSGNVAEWCQDRYGRYSSDAETDPTGPETGTIRVYRGGYWFAEAEWGQVFFRDGYSHTYKDDTVGLRLAL